MPAEGIGVLSSSQEVGMEPAMSSEDLPLIFEPFDDATPEGAMATAPPRAPMPAELATGTLTEADLERVVTMDADRVLSDIPPPGAGEWPSPWQTSGVEMAETVEPSRQPISTVYPGGPADHTGERDIEREGSHLSATDLARIQIRSGLNPFRVQSKSSSYLERILNPPPPHPPKIWFC